MIQFKSQLQNIKDLEERNKLFESLSDEDKRKEIAWDSLMLIMQKIVTGSEGIYWGPELYKIKANNSKQFQQILQQPPTCEVCARGSMMLSQIRLGNNISSNDAVRRCGNSDNIKGFNLDNFVKMECEFERGHSNHPYDVNTTEKLANICCNVIENGNFNTEDQTDYLTKYNIEI